MERAYGSSIASGSWILFAACALVGILVVSANLVAAYRREKNRQEARRELRKARAYLARMNRKYPDRSTGRDVLQQPA